MLSHEHQRQTKTHLSHLSKGFKTHIFNFLKRCVNWTRGSHISGRQGSFCWTINNGAPSGPSSTEQSWGAIRRVLADPSTCSNISAYLWQQRCCWSGSGPACHGPHTPFLCCGPRWTPSVPPWLRAFVLYIRWEMLAGDFRRNGWGPVAETWRFCLGWTRIKARYRAESSRDTGSCREKDSWRVKMT